MPSERRLHPASFLFAIGGQLRQMLQFLIPGLIVLFSTGATGNRWEGWVVIGVVPLALAALVRSLSYRYTLSDDELIVRTGFFFRNVRHIPYRRIQNIEAIQNVAHRLLRVVEVRIETAAGAEDDAKMQVVPEEAYREVRDRVLAGRALAMSEVVADADAPLAAVLEPPTSVLLQLPMHELLLSGLIDNRAAVVIAAGLGVVWEFGLGDAILGMIFDDPVTTRGLARSVIRAWSGGAWPGLWTIAFGTMAVVGAFLLVTALSMVWSAVRLHGFVLRRTGDDLRAEYGLFTRVSTTIPLRRIQTLTVSEGPVYRLFGRATVRVETAGSDATERGGASAKEPLAPIVRREELGRFLAAVLPDVNPSPERWQPAAPGAYGRELRHGAISAAIVSLMVVYLLREWTVGLFAALMLLSAIHAKRFTATLGWATVDGAILFKRGWVRRRLTIARVSKMQTVALHRSPFDRRSAMARVRVDTAGATSEANRIDIPYIQEGTASDLHARLAVEAGNTSFQW
jgi:putative membrane protein